MVVSFDSQRRARPFPSSAVALLHWVVHEYETRCMCVVGSDAADRQGVVRIAEGAQGNRLCASEAWLVRATHRVGIEGFECSSRGQGGKDLQRQGWHTGAQHVEHRQPTGNQMLTWSTFSKNHAGRWLVSATSGGKWRMVLRLKGEICVNLREWTSETLLRKDPELTVR